MTNPCTCTHTHIVESTNLNSILCTHCAVLSNVFVARFCHGAFLYRTKVHYSGFFSISDIELLHIEWEALCFGELEKKAIDFAVLHGQITAPYRLPPAEPSISGRDDSSTLLIYLWIGTGQRHKDKSEKISANNKRSYLFRYSWKKQ